MKPKPVHTNLGLKNRRDLRFELLRIVSACFILFNHINISLVPNNTLTPIQFFNYYMVRFFHLGGKFGVNIFVILGCFFLCTGSFKIQRVYRLILEVVFYGFILNLVDIILFSQKLTIPDFIHGFSYWFPFAYILMLLFIPLINKLLNKGYGKILCILGAFFFSFVFIWGIFMPDRIFKLITLEQVIGSIWFCYLYVLTAQLKSKGFFDDKRVIRIAGFLVFPLYLLMFMLVIITGKSIFRDMYSPLCFLSALCMFLLFQNINENKLLRIGQPICRISSATLGMYLVQCHNNTFQIWNKTVFSYDKWSDSIMLLPICILSVCVLILVSLLINALFKPVINRFSSLKLTDRRRHIS